MSYKSSEYGNKVPGPIARIRRLARKLDGSPAAVASALSEELLVRIAAKPIGRKLISVMRHGKEPERWVFLVGCYNSGTTLLQKMLCAHPEIGGMPREGVRFTSVLHDLEANGHHMYWDDDWRKLAVPARPDAAALVRKDWSAFYNGKTTFLDKSISNTARIEWLAENFRNARFIALHRNGYCISEGLYRRNRAPYWLQEKTGSDRYPVEMLGQLWVDINAEMLQGMGAVNSRSIHAFSDLATKPVETVRAIFADIGFDPDVLKAEGADIKVGKMSFRVHNPDPESLKRLDDNQKEILRPIISGMMEKLGYET